MSGFQTRIVICILAFILIAISGQIRAFSMCSVFVFFFVACSSNPPKECL